MNININPVRDYRSVENRHPKTSHADRYATRILHYGCIPYGMQGLHGIQCSTERYIPMECATNYNTVLNLSLILYIELTLVSRCKNGDYESSSIRTIECAAFLRTSSSTSISGVSSLRH